MTRAGANACEDILRAHESGGASASTRFYDGESVRSGIDFARAVTRCRRAIAARVGADAAVRVAIGCETSEAYLVAFVACASAGLTSGGLNSRWSAREAADAAEACGARVVVLDDAHAARWGRDAFETFAVVIRAEDFVREGFVEEDEDGFGASPTPEDGACAYCFTSGTTGTPKAAILTHEGVLAATRAKIEAVKYSREDVYMHCAPLYHVGGVSSAHATLSVGSSHVFIRRFDAEEVFGQISQRGITAFIAVPTMMSMFVEKAGGRTFPTVLKILVGAGRLRDGQLDEIRRVFPNAKVTLAYGMSETTSSVTFLDPEDERLATDPMFAGNAVRDVEVKTDMNGQILVRGTIVMLGYHGVERARTFDATGWFATGDIGKVAEAENAALDTGPRVWLYGRSKDMIKSGGENVSPEEVERVINSHADVETSVVVGASHEKWGETVVAVVKLRQDAVLSADVAREAIREHCTESHLARFKVPKYIIFVEDVPVNAMGKVSRSAIYDAHRTVIERAIRDH